MAEISLPDNLKGNAIDGTRMGENPGHDVDEALARIDEQMMKRGTLSHSQIDWRAVSADADYVLRRLRHINAFAACVAAAAYGNNPHENDIAITVAEILIAEYWPDCHPLGEGQKRRKQAKLGEILQSLTDITVRLGASGDLTDAYRARLDSLIELAETRGINFKSLRKNLSDSTMPTDDRQSVPAESGTHPAALDPRERAELRRQIYVLATRLQKHYPQDGIAYLMRGFAATMEPGSLPDIDENGKSSIQPMPSSIRESFARALRDRADIGTLESIEERLYNAPDWFEGQKIAVQIAEQLGYSDAARAIRNRVALRLAHYPDFRRICYANGEPYLPPDAVEVLANDEPDVPVETITDDLENRLSKALADGGFEDAARIIDSEIAAARDGRSRARLKIEFARVVKQTGMPEMASMLLEEVRAHILRTDELKLWDQRFLDEIERELKS